MTPREVLCVALRWTEATFVDGGGEVTICPSGNIEPDTATLPTPGSAIVWTADDTESRLLSDLPPRLAFWVQCGPWTAGCTIGLPESLRRDGVSVADLMNSVEGLSWRAVPSERRPQLRRPPLSPQPWKPLPDWIVAASRDWRSNAPIRSATEATALEAGLRQIHDDLDGSHQAAQSIEGEGKHHGDYWHAIMHRREPDYGNSQYWFRRIGRHPVFAPLAREAAAVAEQFGNTQLTEWLPRIMPSGTWNALAFVDCVAAAAVSADDSFRRAVEEIQYREMLLLFAQTYRDAVGT